jgi:UDP-3-O-[3-hydroxymyristoyl] N-acetylglucosamine deacetylase/3-hydroxyacyl-[acyl-carrier-protein] dehydratase
MRALGREDLDVKIEGVGVLNTIKLKFENEPARHKLLDIVGDLALTGKFLRGHILAARPGHSGNVAFAKVLKKWDKERNSIRKFDLSQTVYDINDITEQFFQGHFPNNPVMPGVLQIEAMAQVGGIFALSKVEDPELYSTYFMKIDGVKFKQKVLPGDTLVFRLHLESPIRRGLVNMKGIAYVNGKEVMEATMLAQVVKDKVVANNEITQA